MVKVGDLVYPAAGFFGQHDVTCYRVTSVESATKFTVVACGSINTQLYTYEQEPDGIQQYPGQTWSPFTWSIYKPKPRIKRKLPDWF